MADRVVVAFRLDTFSTRAASNSLCELPLPHDQGVLVWLYARALSTQGAEGGVVGGVSVTGSMNGGRVYA